MCDARLVSLHRQINVQLPVVHLLECAVAGDDVKKHGSCVAFIVGEAAGVYWLLERLIKQDAWRVRIVPALVLAIVSMGYVVFTDLLFNPYMGDNATLRDAPAIATFLADQLDEGDRVLYAKGVPRSYLAWEAWMRYRHSTFDTTVYANISTASTALTAVNGSTGN